MPTLRALGLILPIMFANVCLGQNPKKVQEGPRDFSKEAVVIQRFHVVASFEKDGKSTREYMAVIHVLSEAGAQQFGVLNFGYAAANEDVEIAYVRVRKSNGAVVDTPADNIQDMPSEITRAAPFYSDLREKHVAVKALSPGDMLEYQVRFRTLAPLVPGQFWFEHSFNKQNITLQEQLTISVPREIDIKLKSGDLKPSLAEEAGRRIYVWKTGNLVVGKKTDERADAFEVEDEAPSVRLSSFADWAAVGKWYGALQAERIVPSTAVKAKAAELTRDARTDDAKVRAIYRYVAANFRYIGVALGVGRYQPHYAEEVLSNQYGDCKDKHTLLASLLMAVGIKSYPALIGSTGKVDPDVPSPAQFDHVISAVPLGGELIWLDATPELAPFAFLIPNLRDKQALLIPEQGTPSLVKTPADPPFKSLDLFEVKGKLDGNGTLDAKVKRTLRGDGELSLRLAFRRTPESKWSELVQSLSYLSGFAGTVSNISVSSIEATDAPLTLEYDYTRKKYSDWENRQITPPFPPIAFYSPSEEKNKSSKPIPLAALGDLTYLAEIELPADYSPRLPEAVELKRDFAEYRSGYHFRNGLLTAERRLAVKARELPASRVAEQREFGKAVRQDQEQYIPLTNRHPSEGDPSLAAGPKSEADKLFMEAGAAFQRGDVSSAMELTKRTLALDPKHPRAWTALGFAQAAKGEIEAGIASMRKQIEVTPEQPSAYQALADVLMSMSRQEEAIQVLRGLLKADPNNEVAAASLGGLLMQKKRYAEAAIELEAAAKLNPESARIQQVLGAALVQTGSDDRGMQALQRAILLDGSPATLNNVAYVLAEANRRLPEAHGYAERAVSAEENETKHLRLDELNSEDLARVWRIATYWDTLGWVHFRMGNLQKAEQYLRAAWTLSQSAPVGDHLGQVYEKKGQRTTAARYYALALATGRNVPSTRERLDRILGMSQAARAVESARQKLGQLRTARVKPAKAVKGSAEFFVLFNLEGNVEDVRYASGEEGLRQSAASLRAVHYDLALPQGTTARLLRRGILMCTVPKMDCDFVLLTPQSVHSVD